MKNLKLIAASFCFALMAYAAHGQAVPEMRRSMQFVNFDKPAASPAGNATAGNTPAAGNSQSAAGTPAAGRKAETKPEATREN